MKREQIIEILETHEVGIETKGFYDTQGGYGVQDYDYSKIADAILALPLDVPSDGEIKKEIFKRTTEPIPYTGKNYIPKPVFQFMEEISEWVKDEIIKRNRVI